MNKADFDGVKTEILKQHSQRLGGPVVAPVGPSTLNYSQQICFIQPTLGKDPISNLIRTRTDPSTADSKSYAYEWVKGSAGEEKTFLGLLYMGALCILVSKPTGETLTRAAIKLKRYRNLRVERLRWKFG